MDELADPEGMRAWWAGLQSAGHPPPGFPVSSDSAGLAALRELRSTVRRLAWRNNGVDLDRDTAGDASLGALTLHPDVSDGRLSLGARQAGGTAEDICAAGVAALIWATARPGWPRLKACRAPDCGWVFLDASRNTSPRWCDMAECGNRARSAAFRVRHKR